MFLSPFSHQLDTKDCDPACLRMVSKHHGKAYTIQTLREKSFITREGVSLLGISDAAESIGFRTMGVKIPFEKIWIFYFKQYFFIFVSL